ncbi:hypothetical protein, partial [Dankookia rubra]|uniref:hypothetical protein n=1 Tax=Dankookia rubra TaxID=1442381 RepID=UPI0019D68039
PSETNRNPVAVTKLKRWLPAAPILLRRALQYSSAVDSMTGTARNAAARSAFVPSLAETTRALVPTSLIHWPIRGGAGRLDNASNPLAASRLA